MGAITGDAQRRARPQARTRRPAELGGSRLNPPGDPEPAGLQVASVPGAAAPAPGWEALGSAGPGKL